MSVPSSIAKYTAVPGSFNMNVNAYKTFELKMESDISNDVDEVNENNNADSKNYDVEYCIHRSPNIDHLPYPADNLDILLDQNAIFGNMTQSFYASNLGAWNGITDKVKIKSVTMTDYDVPEGTQLYIYSDANAPGMAENTLAYTQNGLLDGEYFIVIILNDEKLSTVSEAQCTRTLIHELGHAFGMGHPDEDSSQDCEYTSIMYQSDYTDEIAKRSNSVTAHDKYALKSIYNSLDTSAASADITGVNDKEDISIYGYKAFSVDSEDILDINSEYVVKGKILPNKKNVLADFSGYTETPFLIEEVYKGDNIYAGETIMLKEPYYFEMNGDSIARKVCWEDYTESNDGGEYIFYLDKQEGTNLFKLPFLSLSRFEISNFNNLECSSENYQKLKTEVLAKYN